MPKSTNPRSFWSTPCPHDPVDLVEGFRGPHTPVQNTVLYITRSEAGGQRGQSLDWGTGRSEPLTDGSKRFDDWIIWILTVKKTSVCSERARRGGAPPGALKSPTLNQSDGALRHARAAVRPRGRRGHHQRAAARCGARTPTNSGAPRCCLREEPSVNLRPVDACAPTIRPFTKRRHNAQAAAFEEARSRFQTR